MANFMCQFDEPQGAQIKRCFWLCLDEISIWIGGLKADYPSPQLPQFEWASSNPLRA